jgi:hypothetical protein
MIHLKIGNWLITEEGIEWNGTPKVEYLISKERMAEHGHSDRKNMYDFLVHLPEKAWIKKADVYTLNTALIYALEYFKIGFNTNLSFVETLNEQQKILQRKQEEKKSRKH